MTLKKVRKAFFSLSLSSPLIPTVGTVAQRRLRLPAPAAFPSTGPQGCRSLSLAHPAHFRGGEHRALCLGCIPRWSWRSVTSCGDRPWGLRALCQCVASLPAARGGCWHVTANFRRAWWGAGSSSPGFGLLPSPSGFSAAVQSENKPKCSTKGHQAQRPPACAGSAGWAAAQRRQPVCILCRPGGFPKSPHLSHPGAAPLLGGQVLGR